MERFAEKTVKALHFLVDFVIISVIILLVFFAVFTTWETGRIYRGGDSELLASYKPTGENDLGFEDLKEINSDVIAWLDIYGTPIDYPVLQAEDNNKYINHDVFGSFSLTGALFLDHNNKPDFSDFNNIIFGHHMEKEKMFGNLDEFRDKEYFSRHSEGNLYVDGKNYGIKAFAWMDIDAYDPDMYNTRISAKADRKILIDLIKKASTVYVDGVADPDGHVLLLSTCGTETTNERYIFAAMVTKETYEDPYPDEEGSRSLTGGPGSFLERNKCRIFWIVLLFAVISFVIYRRLKRRKRQRHDESQS